MRISKRLVIVAAALIVVMGITAVAGLGVALNRFWPPVREWIRSAHSAKATTARAALKQLSGPDGTDALTRLFQLGIDPATLAAVALNPELGKLLNALGQAPELGQLLRDGAYRETVREAIRQRVRSVSEIELDRTLSPQTRDQVTRVQEVLRNTPLSAAGAELLNPRALDLLEAPTFARLLQDTRFSEYLTRPKAVNEAE